LEILNNLPSVLSQEEILKTALFLEAYFKKEDPESEDRDYPFRSVAINFPRGILNFLEGLSKKGVSGPDSFRTGPLNHEGSQNDYKNWLAGLLMVRRPEAELRMKGENHLTLLPKGESSSYLINDHSWARSYGLFSLPSKGPPDPPCRSGLPRESLLF
jgi:hypothetical protein